MLQAGYIISMGPRKNVVSLKSRTSKIRFYVSICTESEAFLPYFLILKLKKIMDSIF
jgi:hypothetical protein